MKEDRVEQELPAGGRRLQTRSPDPDIQDEQTHQTRTSEDDTNRRSECSVHWLEYAHPSRQPGAGNEGTPDVFRHARAIPLLWSSDLDEPHYRLGLCQDSHPE